MVRCLRISIQLLGVNVCRGTDTITVSMIGSANGSGSANNCSAGSASRGCALFTCVGAPSLDSRATEDSDAGPRKGSLSAVGSGSTAGICPSSASSIDEDAIVAFRPSFIGRDCSLVSIASNFFTLGSASDEACAPLVAVATVLFTGSGRNASARSISISKPDLRSDASCRSLRPIRQI